MHFTKNIERSGYIKTFERVRKTLKDFLESEIWPSPRKMIQQAFQSGYIAEGHSWIDALEKRNLLAHTYNEELSKEACLLIKEKYFEMLEQFYKSFKEQCDTI